MPDYPEITGRDDYLIAQALHEAIKALSMRPIEDRPRANIEGMRRILLTRYRGAAMVQLIQEDIKAALAELPEDSPLEVVSDRITAVTTEWNERYRSAEQVGLRAAAS